MLKAVILAAGMARRLKPLTDHTPKCLLKVCDKTILGMTLDNLSAHEIRDIVIVTGFEGTQIVSYTEKYHSGLNIQFIHNPDFETTNNSYSLWLATGVMKGCRMLLLDSDIVFEPNIIPRLMESEHNNCLALNTGVKLGSEEIKVRTDETGCILEISKEVNPLLASGESIGIELFDEVTTAMLFSTLEQRMISEKRVNEFYEASFEEMIRNGKKIYAIDIAPNKCMEIDTPTDLKNAAKMLNMTVL